LRLDWILAGTRIEAEGITGEQIAGKDDIANFYGD